MSNIKPLKFRSLSLCGGKRTLIHFHIGENVVKSVNEDSQKFLGSFLASHGKESEIYDHVFSQLNSKLFIINYTLIWNELGGCPGGTDLEKGYGDVQP